MTQSNDHTIRLHSLNFNLLYPAVLGTIFYNLLPALASISGSSIKDAKLWICIAIVFHFAIDYVFVRLVKPYPWFSFLIDLVVLFLLFLAYDALNFSSQKSVPSVPIEVRQFSWALSGVYVAFILWARLMRHEIGRQPVLLAVEIAAAVLFFVFPSTSLDERWLAGLLVLATVGLWGALAYGGLTQFQPAQRGNES